MLHLIAGGGHPQMAQAIARELGVELTPVTLARYPDAELVRIDGSIRNGDIYIVQPTPPSPEPHLIELLLIADAARRAGAARICAVTPYVGYSRQDRRAAGDRTAVGGRVVANMVDSGGFDRFVTVDLHQPAMEGFFSTPVEHIEAFGPLLEALREASPRGTVVAPDVGAAKLADRFAEALSLPMAVVHKTRLSGTEVVATRVTGDVAGRTPIIVDDMITTGGTVRAAVEAVTSAGAHGPVTVAVTHGIFSAEAPARLAGLGIERLIATDTVPITSDGIPGLQVVSIAPMLAETIRRLHDGSSIAHLRSKR